MPRHTRRAFTLIELLVVISIIALLISILLPALANARKSQRALASLTNLRSWGQGMAMFGVDYDGMIPWDGEKDPGDFDENYAEQEWWGNAIPPYVDQPGYVDVQAHGTVPLPGDKGSIFIDPSAQADPSMPAGGWNGAGGSKFYFNYVFNANLDNNSDYELPLLTSGTVVERMRDSMFRETSSTILMIEMRSTRDELPAGDSFYGEDLDRQKSDWQRFSARHRQGGHIAFADGHADFFTHEKVTELQTSDHVVPALPGYNQKDLIWDPLGRGI